MRRPFCAAPDIHWARPARRIEQAPQDLELHIQATLCQECRQLFLVATWQQINGIDDRLQSIRPGTLSKSMGKCAEKRHLRARQQDPLAKKFRTPRVVPHSPLKLPFGRTFQHTPVKIQVHPALCQIPAITPERGTVKQRLPGHAVLRRPPVVSQEATRLPQLVERHEDIHIPHRSARPGVGAHAGGESLDDDRRHLPAQAGQ